MDSVTEPVIWISSLSRQMYDHDYGRAVDTWYHLPGRKILLFEGDTPKLDFVEFLDYWQLIDRKSSTWLTRKISKKALRLSLKAYALHWALKNLSADRIIWIDADVQVHQSVPLELLDNGDNLWSTLMFHHSSNLSFNGLGIPLVESGLQIFNMNHPDIQAYADTYIDFFESGRALELHRPYDNWVSAAMLDLFPMDNLVHDPEVIREISEDSLKHTRFQGYMTHYLGKGNKQNIPKHTQGV